MAVVASLPDWLVMKMNPGVVELLTWKGRLGKTQEVLDETLSAGHLQPTKDRTIIHDLVASNLPPDENPPHCLADESLITAGGGVTTGDAMSKTCFYILQNPAVLTRLQQELLAALPDIDGVPSLAAVQQLPYLECGD
jgi:hypothetical protein